MIASLDLTTAEGRARYDRIERALFEVLDGLLRQSVFQRNDLLITFTSDALRLLDLPQIIDELQRWDGTPDQLDYLRGLNETAKMMIERNQRWSPTLPPEEWLLVNAYMALLNPAK